MKIAMLIILVLSIGLLFVAGCSSDSNDSGTGQPNQNAQNQEPDQQNAGSRNIPEPPAFPED